LDKLNNKFNKDHSIDNINNKENNFLTKNHSDLKNAFKININQEDKLNNDITIFKKEVFIVENTNSNLDCFVLKKLPLFSCKPFSKEDGLKFLNDDNDIKEILSIESNGKILNKLKI